MHRRLLIALALIALAGCGSLAQTQPTVRPTIVVSTPIPPTAAPETASAPAAELPRLREPLPAIPADDPRAIGDPDAPVTIIEYSDFQCPFCLRHFMAVFPELKAKYIDTGKVRYVFRNYIAVPQHYAAPAAGIAGLCATEQNKFWEFHDKMFKSVEQWGADPNAAPTMLSGYASELGLDQAKFAECQNDPSVMAKVNAEGAQGIGFGANGTPAFFVGQYLVAGAQSLDVFDKAIAMAENDIR